MFIFEWTTHFAFVTENGYKDVTPNGPSESNPKRRQRRRTPRSEPCYPNKQLDSEESQLSVSRKPSRAKSQPPSNTKERTSNRENRRSFILCDWAERHIETRDRRTPNIRASMSAGEVRPDSNRSFLYWGNENYSHFQSRWKHFTVLRAAYHYLRCRNLPWERPVPIRKKNVFIYFL